MIKEVISTKTANLRCAGAIYLLRFILRKYCQCGEIEPGTNVCRHRHMPLWPVQLYRMIGIPENRTLRAVAHAHGSMLYFTFHTPNFAVNMVDKFVD